MGVSLPEHATHRSVEHRADGVVCNGLRFAHLQVGGPKNGTETWKTCKKKGTLETAALSLTIWPRIGVSVL